MKIGDYDVLRLRSLKVLGCEAWRFLFAFTDSNTLSPPVSSFPSAKNPSHLQNLTVSPFEQVEQVKNEKNGGAGDRNPGLPHTYSCKADALPLSHTPNGYAILLSHY